MGQCGYNQRGSPDASIFVVQETGREFGEPPEKIAVSVITAAELELGAGAAHRDPLARPQCIQPAADRRTDGPLLRTHRRSRAGVIYASRGNCTRSRLHLAV